MMRAATRSAFLFAAVTACSDVVDSNKVGPENIPTVRLNPGQLEFAVNARNWTFDNTYVPDNFYSISNDPRPLDVGVAISEYSGGGGAMTITDGDNAVVFNQTLAGNVATGTHITVTGKAPFKIHIVANNYTGVVALGTTETGS
jgi:hypothetical protein